MSPKEASFFCLGIATHQWHLLPIFVTLNDHKHTHDEH